MKDVAIKIEGLGKRYRYGGLASLSANLRADIMDWIKGVFHRGHNRPRSLREIHEQHLATDASYFWALENINLEIKQGEVVGIIGRNGAGKSTLLKILARITPPTTGRVIYRGRVASLLEVGTGFHRELTGRENIYLNGSILGMRRAEITRRLDEIVAFAEIDKFLDTPVKFYSSGMYVRLAFAVAAHLDTDIMLVDEVLAVGDAAFQQKCLGKMNAVAKSGRTVIFVSHNMAAVQHLCSHCILLNQGRIVLEGTTDSVIAAYSRALITERTHYANLTAHPGRLANATPSMTAVRIRSGGIPPGELIYMNDDVEIVVSFVSQTPLDNVTFGLVVKNQCQVPIFGLNNLFLRCEQPRHPVTQADVICRIPNLPLMPGKYSLDLYLGTHGTNFDIIFDALIFEVLPRDVFGTGKLPPPTSGSIFLPASWKIVSKTYSE